MPGSRDPNKAGVSLWMHKDIFNALTSVSRERRTTVTRFILEALSEKMGFTLDAHGFPIGLETPDAEAAKGEKVR